MASSPRLAKSAAVIGGNGNPKSILVDGEEFPFYVAEDIAASNTPNSRLRQLTVTILVDGPISLYDKEALD